MDIPDSAKGLYVGASAMSFLCALLDVGRVAVLACTGMGVCERRRAGP